jgi:serine/threonine-protein kinase
MGVVYLARSVHGERLAAIKLVAADFARDHEFRERFARESRMARAVDHPNIVRVREAGEVDGLLYILMQYIEGRDLRAVIEERGRLAPGRSVEILGEVASALDAAHAQGLLHRDVKPANILIASVDGQAYLADFGLAIQAGALTHMTRSGQWVGTVDYLAPERIEGKPEDARTDVYSLGCVLYQALTGALPFPKNSDIAKMYAHVNDPPPAPRALAAELPAAFDQVILRALAKDPAARYASAGELAARAAEAAQGAEPDELAATGETRAGQVLPEQVGERDVGSAGGRGPLRRLLHAIGSHAPDRAATVDVKDRERTRKTTAGATRRSAQGSTATSEEQATRTGSVSPTQTPGTDTGLNGRTGQTPRRPVRMIGVAVLGAAIIGGVAASLLLGRSHKPATATVHLNAEQMRGSQLFTRSCAGCHTLAAAGATGHVGPYLDVRVGQQVGDLRARDTLVENTIEEGRNRGLGKMPARLYQGADAREVASFVAIAATQDVGGQVSAAPTSTAVEKAGKLELEAAPNGQLAYTTTKATATAGPVLIEMPNMSGVTHNLAIQAGTGPNGPVLVATSFISNGNTSLVILLKPGTYTFFCQASGHRQAGMYGTLTVK